MHLYIYVFMEFLINELTFNTLTTQPTDGF